MDLLIVGAGAMGQWFARSVDATVTSVTFVDLDRRAAVAAAETVGGDADTDTTAGDLEIDESYDVVCIAVPMPYAAAAIETHASKTERAIVDVTGVMAPPLEAMARHAHDRERVSLHPLFAPERAPGSVAVVRGESGPTTDALLAALEKRGNRLVETSAAEHDRAMESVQAAAHAAVLAFALAADPVPEGFETPVYEELRTLIDYVTAGNPRVYADIQTVFDGSSAVADAALALDRADEAAFEQLYERASAKWQSERGDEP